MFPGFQQDSHETHNQDSVFKLGCEHQRKNYKHKAPGIIMSQHHEQQP